MRSLPRRRRKTKGRRSVDCFTILIATKATLNAGKGVIGNSLMIQSLIPNAALEDDGGEVYDPNTDFM